MFICKSHFISFSVLTNSLCTDCLKVQPHGNPRWILHIFLIIWVFEQLTFRILGVALNLRKVHWNLGLNTVFSFIYSILKCLPILNPWPYYTICTCCNDQGFSPAGIFVRYLQTLMTNYKIYGNKGMLENFDFRMNTREILLSYNVPQAIKPP